MTHESSHIIIKAAKAVKAWLAEPVTASLKNGYALGIGAAFFIAGAWIF
jgi:hypothetical protein